MTGVPSVRGLLCAALCVSLCVSGCATTQYTPQVVARGELTVRYEGRFEIYAGGKPVAHGLLWTGLPEFVRCVKQAREEAGHAADDGALAVTLSVLGGTLGGVSLAGLAGALADQRDHAWYWVGGAAAVGGLGAVFAGLGRLHRNRANGHALDALNQYNDAVGSLGATCDDLQYPPPVAAPAPGEPLQYPLPAGAPIQPGQ